MFIEDDQWMPLFLSMMLILIIISFLKNKQCGRIMRIAATSNIREGSYLHSNSIDPLVIMWGFRCDIFKDFTKESETNIMKNLPSILSIFSILNLFFCLFYLILFIHFHSMDYLNPFIFIVEFHSIFSSPTLVYPVYIFSVNFFCFEADLSEVAQFCDDSLMNGARVQNLNFFHCFSLVSNFI
jgi:hypothetical protein